MRRIFRWLGIFLVSVVGLVLVAIALVFALSEYRFNRRYDIAVQPVEIPTDTASIAYGEHVVNIRSCKGCHGDDLSGRIEFEDPMVGRISNANLTTGEGGIGDDYTVEDWVRTIRHGVKPDGRPVLIMPSHTFHTMSDEDLGAVIAYLETLPPVDNVRPRLTLALLPRAMYLAGPMDFLVPADLIDHDAPLPPAPERGPTAAYGDYLAGMCTLCHGPGLSGGPIPGTPSSDPPARNLTPGGRLPTWTFEDFRVAMRTGATPDGGQLRDEYMPYSIFSEMTDEELEAIWLYLQSVPARDFGNR